MYYAHIHPDDNLIPVFPPKPVCDHNWEEIDVDYESFKTQCVIMITVWCSRCGKEDKQFRQAGGH
jgi:hypothetical protein